MAKRDPVDFIEDFRALSLTLKTVMAAEYAALELGATQASFVRHIGRNPSMSQADLARATQSDPGLTGRTLEKLIERGWVRRTRSEDDRRQYILELSATGQRIRKRVEEARRRAAESVVSHLTEADLEAFEKLVGKLTAAFERDD